MFLYNNMIVKNTFLGNEVLYQFVEHPKTQYFWHKLKKKFIHIMFLKTLKTYFVEVVLTTIGLIFNMFQINYSHPRVVSEYVFSVSLVKMGSVVQTLDLAKNIETYSWYIRFLNTNVPFLFHSFLTDSLPLNRPNYSSPIALFALTNFPIMYYIC